MNSTKAFPKRQCHNFFSFQSEGSKECLHSRKQTFLSPGEAKRSSEFEGVVLIFKKGICNLEIVGSFYMEAP